MCYVVCRVSVGEASQQAIEIVAFSSSNRIDQDKISGRDMSRPFFFTIENLKGHKPLPFTVDKGSDFHVWLDKRTPNAASPMPSSARSLALSLESKVDENVKDKVFFDAVPWKSEHHLLATGDLRERFVSFDMNLASPYDTPKYWVIHLQAWQCCGGHPPFMIAVLPKESDADKIMLEVAIRNDATERNNKGQELQIAKFQVARDRWFHVSLDLEPAPIGGGSGMVKAWVDDKKIADWRGNWGYAPIKTSGVTQEEVKPDIGLDIGVYRRRQPGTQTVLIDNIHYGTSIESVDFK